MRDKRAGEGREEAARNGELALAVYARASAGSSLIRQCPRFICRVVP